MGNHEGFRLIGDEYNMKLAIVANRVKSFFSCPKNEDINFLCESKNKLGRFNVISIVIARLLSQGKITFAQTGVGNSIYSHALITNNQLKLMRDSLIKFKKSGEYRDKLKSYGEIDDSIEIFERAIGKINKKESLGVEEIKSLVGGVNYYGKLIADVRLEIIKEDGGIDVERKFSEAEANLFSAVNTFSKKTDDIFSWFRIYSLPQFATGEDSMINGSISIVGHDRNFERYGARLVRPRESEGRGVEIIYADAGVSEGYNEGVSSANYLVLEDGCVDSAGFFNGEKITENKMVITRENIKQMAEGNEFELSRKYETERATVCEPLSSLF
jgi:hypothetical protein